MATSPTPPSSSLPQPLSYQQILGNALSSFAASTGINDLNVGSATTSLFQVVSLMVARASGDIFQVLRDNSLDRATGPALQNLAISFGVTPIGAEVATSFVTVTDLSFQKIFTTIYAGANPPIIGSTTIYASNAEEFPATGSIYIGRGSVNVEGPLPYSSITVIGSYYAFNLSSQTTKYHNIGESIILSQGGVRTIPANTLVVSPGIGTTPSIQYIVSQIGTILDGETTVTNVPVTALLPGSVANVPAGSISQFAGNPPGLSNASVTNPNAVTTGQDTETDDQLRVRVKNALASTGLGTVTAIESALQGVQAPNSSDTIVSTDVLNSATNTTVYIDNGSVLEATHQGVPIEAIVNSALGGEKYFQLVTGGTQTSVTKALLQTVAAEPFNLSGGEHLTVVVGNITYDHVFNASDFANPGSATAYEVAASINGDTVLNFEAVTAGAATYVVIRPEDEVTNKILVTTPADPTQINANDFLQFPSQIAETLRLYKNGILLTEDGTTASIFTNPQSLWSSTIASGETLSISVDGTAPITYTITNAEFIAEGTYVSVSYSNSLQSWVNVLNNLITGITASIVGSSIEISSNLGAIDRAQIAIVNTISNPTSLISKGMINSANLNSTGVISDYILDRNTAQIELAVDLVKGDSLSAGTLITQANIEASIVSSGSVTLTSDAHVWIAIDTNAVTIPTIQSGSLLSVSQVSPNIIRYTSNSANAFSNVLTGDYVIVWSAEIPVSDQLEGRVHAVTGTTLDIEITVAEYSAITPVSNAAYVQGFVVVRTAYVPQKFVVTTGTKTLDVIAAELQTQTDELTFGVFNNSNITVVTNTFDTTGQIVVVTEDQQGALLGFVAGTANISQPALIANYETQASAAELPLFFHSTISADAALDPTSLVSTLTPTDFNPNELVEFLNPYGVVPGIILDDEQPANEIVQMTALSGPNISFVSDPDVIRLREKDRYFIANPLDFGYNDSVVAIVDNNTIGETYTMPLYRAAQVNSTYPSNNYSFNAYDVAAGATASFISNFSSPTDFFANYKVLMQAKQVVSGSNANTSLLYRSAMWGNSGEAVNISYVYPTSANQPISSAVTNNDSINIAISLISGSAIATSITANTQWNVTVTPNTPTTGIDQLTFTYAANQYIYSVVAANATIGAVYSNNSQLFTVNSTIIAGSTLITSGTSFPLSSGTLTLVSGTGDATITFTSYYGPGISPSLPVSLGNGAYVTISTATGFPVADTGTFAISKAVGFTPTSTAFSVQVPSGTAVAKTGVVTTVATGMSFYVATPTTASAINTYVNANLSQYVTTTIVGGTGPAETQYTFTISAANASAGAVYSNNSQTFTVSNSIVAGTTLVTIGTNAPLASGTLTLVSGTGASTITYTAFTSIAINGSGSGIISLSTYEDNDFAIHNFYLQDGINWIASSNVGGSPQFTLKEPLSYPNGPGYSFFSPGDMVRLIPTTMDQVKELWNVLAVTGFTTVGTIETSDRGTKLQLASNTIGSGGSIQVVGGSGNEYVVPILTSGELIDNTHMVVSANSIAAQAVASDQWFRLQAANYQNKNTGFSNNTSVSVLSNTPIGGESTITVSGQELGQLYFGSPRNGIRIEGDTFRIEKQGDLACLSWDGVGSAPDFSYPVNFNDIGGWVVNVAGEGVYSVSNTPLPPPSPLATAATYAVLGATSVTNSGSSVLTGNLGISPGTSITGFPPGTYSGTENIANAASANAQSQALSAYNTMAAETATAIPSVLDGQVLTPGVYKEASGTFNLAASGAATLTLNGAGTYIFQCSSTLVTGAGGIPTITLENGATAANVFWIVGSSATINSGYAGTFEGNVIAHTSITDTLGGTINGSLIALTGAVTLSAAAIINVATVPAVPNTTNFSALTVGDIITISGLVNSVNNGTFIVTGVSPNGLILTTTNSSSVPETGTVVIAGDFTATSSVSEGDTMIISAPFSPLNQGEFRVIRMSENSVWYENPNTLEEEVTCVANSVSTGYDATTVFNIEVINGVETLVWTGTGTAPSLQNLLPGDVVTFGSGFSTPNQGSFIVSQSGSTQPQIVQLTMPSGATFAASGPANYFEIYNGGNADKYYVWFNVSGGSNTDPAPVGFTGIEVTVNNSDNSITVANETKTALSALVNMTSSVSLNVITVSATVSAPTNIPVDVSMPSAFSFIVTQMGQLSSVSVINPSGVAQLGISSVTFSVNNPQIQFFPYNATVPGDKIVINGTVLGTGNAGTYKVLQVLSPNTVVVSGTISTQYNTNLAGNSVSFNVQEGTKYTGYKQVSYVAMQPGTANYTNIIFNTIAQYDKINLSAGVAMTALGKLNFPITIVNGTDAYNYDTGLIGQANRVIYGDPRDSVTFPGVNAAGTSIFIREPLLKSISIALAIRTNIGVSFAQITSQIQSSVYALVQSNPLGQSLDLSSIVETVRAIPGVTSVVLTSPVYNVTNDSISLGVGQKAFIPSQTNNISISLIGS